MVASTGVGPRLMFDLDDPYWERYFGKDGKGKISEAELGLIFGVRHTPLTRRTRGNQLTFSFLCPICSR